MPRTSNQPPTHRHCGERHRPGTPCPISVRPGEGERCDCGRPARVVHISAKVGRVPDCGVRDGGRRTDQEVTEDDR